MANRFVDKIHNGTLASPTEVTDTASNRQLLQNRPEAAGLSYDRASKTFKYNGSDEIRTLESNYNRVITPTGTYTLVAGESGSEIFLNAAAGFTINLPEVAAGLKFRFTVGAAFATTPFVVTAPTANSIFGGATVAGSDVPADAEDNINFVETAELPGDFVDVWSDGVKWFVNGRGTTAGSITFTT